MIRVRYIIVSGVCFAAAAACWLIQHAGDAELRKRGTASKERAARLALLQKENLALSNTVALSNSAAGLEAEELRELARLRGEVALLRQSIREIDRLRDTNSIYVNQLASAHARDAEEAAPGGCEPAQDIWAREQFAYAGFSEPELALKTTLWIWVDADLAELLPHCTPEQRAELEQVWSERSETEIAAMRQRMAALYSLDRGGVRLMSKKLNSPEEALLDLYFEGDGKRRRFRLQKTGDQWSVTSLVAIYN